MLEQPKYVQGVFVKELDNRFRCLVNIAGKDTICYVPSSCKLEKLIPLKGKKVLLRPTQKSSTPYSVYAVQFRNSYCLLNLSYANRIIFEQINRRIFDCFGNRKCVTMEKNISGYKSDLYIQETNTIVEIKTVLSTQAIASFSTVHSERAVQQLEKLEALINCGYSVTYLIVGLGPTISKVVIDRSSAIYQQLSKCMAAGMQVYGVSLHIKNKRFEVFRPITIEL